jgi:thiamine-phosphate pyrophosphorylase
MSPRHRKIHRKASTKRMLPALWLFTDERVDEAALLRAVERLPRGAGIVFRHYGLEPGARYRLFRVVHAAARKRGLLILLAGNAADAAALKADGWHAPARFRPMRGVGARLIRTVPCHGQRNLHEAERAGADIAFLSPLFATRSHPHGATLGPVRFGLWARNSSVPVVPLGGMTAKRARRLKSLGGYGWAAIDALSG